MSLSLTPAFGGPEEWPAMPIQKQIPALSLNKNLPGEIFMGLVCNSHKNVSLNQEGWALITPGMLVNNPDYPLNQYVVDIMGPLNDTVYCAQIGQQVMAAVTELPTGNVCMSELTVEDKLAPAIDCENDTIPCNADIDSIDFLSYVQPLVDNCDPDPDVFYTYGVEALNCDPNGFAAIIHVVYTAEDEYNNVAVCSLDIYMEKSDLADVMFPPDTMISCVNADTDPSNTGEPTVFGEPVHHFCELISWYNDMVIDMCDGQYKILRSWNVMDWCTGMSLNEIQEILVIDTIPPELTCPDDLTIGTVSFACYANYTIPQPMATDICSADSLIEYLITINTVPGLFDPGEIVQLDTGMHIITFRATDDCNNTATCTYTVTVIDDDNPTLACTPIEITLDPVMGMAFLPADSPDFFASDNCGVDTILIRRMEDNCGVPEDTMFNDTLKFCCADVGEDIMIAVKATDLSGNMTICMIEVTVRDGVPPVITCPPDVSIECDESTDPANTGMATAIDNCDPDPNITFSDMFVQGACPQEGVITRTWTATDAGGDSASCIQQITITDTNAPSITCPPDITIDCEDSQDPANTGNPVVMDNCDMEPLVTFSDNIVGGGCPEDSTITRTWIATDACGNSSSCTQVISIIDMTPPDLSICPSLEMILECDAANNMAEAIAWNAANIILLEGCAMDNCDIDLTGQVTSDFDFNNLSDECGETGSLTVTYTVSDNCGNSSTAQGVLTILDTTPPDLSGCGPRDATIECVAADNEANADIWHAANIAALEACASDTCDTDLAGQVSSDYNYANLNVTCGETGSLFVTYTVTDDCGNSSTFTATLTIEDTTPPDLSGCGVLDMTIECDALNNEANAVLWNALNIASLETCSSDTCDTDLTGQVTSDFNFANLSDDCGITGSIPVTYTVTDDCGNSSTLTATLTIEDTLPPDLSGCGPLNMTVDCNVATNMAMADLWNMNNIAALEACGADLCDSVLTGQVTSNYNFSNLADSCGQTGTLLVTFTVSDACANSSTFTATFTIIDTIPPLVIFAPADTTIDCDSDIGAVEAIIPIWEDACGGFETFAISALLPDTSCPNAYIIDREWTAVDSCGNSTTVEQIITVQDTVAPDLSACPALDATIECDFPNNETNADAWNATNISTLEGCTSDNCTMDFAGLVTSDYDFTGYLSVCGATGSITVTYTVDDGCGNVTMTTGVLTIEDTNPPVISCASDITIECGESTDPANTGITTATDACDTSVTVTFSDVVTPGVDCYLESTITRTWLATDDCGNTVTCVQTITVEDTTPPVITCPADATIECDESRDPANTGGFPTAIDNCDPNPIFTFTDMAVSGSCPQDSIITRTWTATDACGNSAVCIQTIFVIDTTPPVITCPADVTVDCDAFTELLVNGDFETMDFTGWIELNTGLGDIVINDGTFDPVGPDGPLMPCEGGSGAVTFQSGPGTHTLYQEVTIPAGAISVTLAWTDMIRNHHTEFIEPSQEFRVEVWNTSNIVLEELFSTEPGDPLLNGCLRRTADLSAYAGQTIRIAFTEQDAFFFFNVHLDDVSLLYSETTPATGMATAIDACDDEPFITFSDTLIQGACPQEGVITRTWVATDHCGNSSSCTQIITVQDTIAPVIVSCPSGGYLGCNPSALPGPNTAGVTATDNCGGSNVIVTANAIQDDTIGCTGTLIYEYTVADSCGNSATCQQTYTYTVDNEPPLITTCPQGGYLGCNPVSLPGPNTGDVVANDNCSGIALMISSAVIQDDTSGCVGTLIFEYTVTDSCSNSSTCQEVYTYTVDNEPPVITACAPGGYLGCNPVGLPSPNPGNVIASDNCSGTTLDITSAVLLDDTTGCTGILIYEYTVTDSCGNASTCLETYAYTVDNEPPLITVCPPGGYLGCNPGMLPPANPGGVVASDNCSGTTLTINATTIQDDTTGCLGVLVYQYSVMDSCGNSSTCLETYTYTVDNEAPVITACAPGGYLGCNPSVLPGPNTGAVVATDNCSGTTLIINTSTIQDDTTGCAGTLVYEYTVTDSCGNSAMCQQTYTYTVDNEDPVILACPSGGYLGCNPAMLPGPNTGGVVATDNCSGSTLNISSSVILDDTTGCEGTLIYEYTVTDSCGNSTTCQQIYTYTVDNEDPVILACAAGGYLGCNPIGLPGSNVGAILATDNCSGTTLIINVNTIQDDTIGCDGTLIYEYTVADSCGNSATCQQIYTYTVDNEDPVITVCAAGGYLGCNPTVLPGANVGAIVATDNCSGVDLMITAMIVLDDTVGCLGTLIFEYAVEDSCGNFATCQETYTYTVDDENPVILACPSGGYLGCNPAMLPGPDAGGVVAIDNCSGTMLDISSSVVLDDTTGCDGILIYEYTVTDSCGNSATCQQIHTYTVDNEDPVITACGSGGGDLGCNPQSLPLPNTEGVEATDNCSGMALMVSSSTVQDDTVGCVGTLIFEYTVSDSCGNSATCQEVYTYTVDNEVPMITSCASGGDLGCNPAMLPAPNPGGIVANDNCSGTTLMISSMVILDDTTNCDGTLIYEYTVTDSCGNGSTCQEVYTYTVDNIPPSITCPADVTVECFDLVPEPDINDVITSDNCSAIIVTHEGDDTTMNNVTRTYLATDACGNSASCTQTITVDDTTPPLCVAQDITVTLDINGMVTITPEQIDNGSSDNCGSVTLELDTTMFDCDDIDDNIVILTVTDQSGNTSTCSATVTVEDPGDLQAICQNITIFLDENGMVSITPEQIDNGSGGTCAGELMLELDIENFNCTDLGSGNIVTLTVTDDMGNTASCTAIVTVEDPIPPEITCPADMTAECEDFNINDLSGFGNATGDDNCPGFIVTEQVSGQLDECGLGVVVRTFTVTDTEGNTVTCQQTITVINSDPFDEDDITPPPAVINLPECSSTEPGDIPNSQPIVMTNGCEIVTIVHMDSVVIECDTMPNTPCVQVYRTWIITDSCQYDPMTGEGQFIYDQLINVNDVNGPDFDAINDITVLAGPDCETFVELIATASDCDTTVTNIINDFNPIGGADASGDYPLGTTTVTFTAFDACCNSSILEVDVTVEEENQATWQCEKLIVFMNDFTIVTLHADTFVIVTPGDCTGEDDYYFSYSNDDPFDSIRMFDCSFAGTVTTFHIFVFNTAEMLIDSCLADLDLRDPENFCTMINGEILSQNAIPDPEVSVYLFSGGLSTTTSTDNTGYYRFDNVSVGQAYTVKPFRNSDHKRGVSTLDLVYIQKHLLGLQRLTGPYNMIAADANGSGDISVGDIVEIRKLILGLQHEFQGMSSWRYVDAQYDFPDAEDPWMQSFPESVFFESIQNSVNEADFVSIKVGDVNNSAFITSQTMEVKSRSGEVLTIVVPEITGDAQKVIKLPVSLDKITSLNGFQCILHVDPAMAEIISVQTIEGSILNNSNFAVNSYGEGAIALSWHSDKPVSIGAGEPLLNINMRMAGNIPMTDILTISDQQVSPEAYIHEGDEVRLIPVNLRTSRDQYLDEEQEVFVVYDSRPNPFDNETRIPVYISENSRLSVLIHDLQGQLVSEEETWFMAGDHEIVIREQLLPASGMYYVTIASEKAAATRKIILVR